MCGINGFIQFTQRYSPEQMESIVHSMNERIIHRGPDSEGLYADERCALGMRRLAIIDVDNGRQPIWNTAGNKMIVFNGELYNFLQLKESLIQGGYPFRTRSDTEVVLAGFETYGYRFFSMMEGMFALAIYDTTEKQWIFARDRIGEKPLYYYASDALFVFSSELKGILDTGLVPKEIDPAGLSQFFQLTYIPGPGSIIKDVKKLPPATYMVLRSDGGQTIEKYWSLTISGEPVYADYDKCKAALRDALFASVSNRMISDVPLGAFLSGGIDSSIIVGIMASISDERISTFNIGFRDKEFDESGLAWLVAKKYNTRHHVFYLNWDNAFQDVSAVLSNIDEPFADPSLIATYVVSRMTKQYVTVALTGDAGDELFAGYDKYLIAHYSKLYNAVPAFLRKGLVEPAVRCFPADSGLARKMNKVISSARMDSFERRKNVMLLGFKADETARLLPRTSVDSLNVIRRYYDALQNADEQTRAQFADLNVVLDGCMLAKVDRASMLASLETRVPMLDSKVVELAFNIPTSFRMRGTHRKIILKDAFSDMIPDALHRAPKHGFNVPVGKWLRKELESSLRRYASPELLLEQGLFEPGYVGELVDGHMTNRENNERKLWAFYVFQYWYENVFQRC